MKYYSTLFIILFFSINAFCQNEFSGVIEYSTQAIEDTHGTGEISKKGDISKSTFYFENGSFYQTYDNKAYDFDYFDAETLIHSIKYFGNDTLYLFNTRMANNSKLTSAEIEEDVEKVLGILCDKLTLEITSPIPERSFLLEIFFAKNATAINKEDFKGAKFNYIEEIYSRTGAIPLKFIYHLSQGSFIAEATDIKHQKDLDLENVFKKESQGLPVKKLF
ncbi:hypothetical protein [Flammeovirga sp. OC4]|uniref:hypothetical protein n=1 Tax=Flammeovirga sp. OC4 TaxID=1382345 RepID=UPI0005C77D99|nr:hypothetical protein [Flammeovirga sp. OC4]